MSKLVYISHEPLTRYLYGLFYMEEIYRAGFEINYWDCSALLWNGITLPDMLQLDVIRKIHSIDEFAECLKGEKMEDTIFSVEVKLNANSLPIFKLLTEQHCCIVRFKLFENAVLHATKKEIFRSIQTGKIFVDIKNRMTHICSDRKRRKMWKENNIKAFDAVFSSTNDGSVYINHPDYDRCLQVPASIFPKSKHIVYLDNYFPFHPDIIKNNPNVEKINVEQHYKEINELFGKIESKYNQQVIIAAHPKADYKKNEFQNREIIKYKTQELVAEASLVLLHSSNAIAFAIGYGIPFMFISTSQYQMAHRDYYRMRRLSCYFNAPIITCSEADSQIDNWVPVSSQLLDKYKYEFLTKPSIEKTENIDIIIPELRRMIDSLHK